MKKIKITETAFRDAHQSLLATRMRTDEMLPIADKMDRVGYYAMEVWGGATFDSCLRFLNEDPWDRLRKLRKAFKNTKLQMLLRGQNLLGYKNYPDDIVEEFVKKSIENGIDIIRMFDALNDMRNIQKTLEATKKYGGHAQIAISYTVSPVHNIEYYVQLAKEMENMGADSICIKDMSGILLPYVAEELIKKLKKVIKIPIEIHSHFTSGIANQTYMKAIEAGADIIDTAISPLGMGASQPATESMVSSLKYSPYDPDLDMDLLMEIAEYFKGLKDKYIKEGLLKPKIFDIDARTLKYQVPGGMLSNLLSQLEYQGASDKFEDVLEEIPKVREDLGYPPLVTPMSQMVGTQALSNVLMGERYKLVSKEIKNYVKGLYGKPTVPIREDIKKKIIGDEEVYTGRPADLLKPQLEQCKNEIKEYMEQDEDVLSYALFPQVALNYFKYRQAKKYKIDCSLTNEEYKVYPI
ncbi:MULTISPECIES: oxaloacetate decarboxylase subunit alpha [Tissierellales]|uniref:Oxaloacetate decarboxylase subunit alpha n=1 Tax=Acidilutibacter cellobiosedens TaxID=2507161 RepID=A0A410QCK9_9FIRM|nr:MULTISPECIES: oxaloacetate decarboxylase subunit alpha [Tissierellales]MBE6082046.1 oxaloacetate decarboxylase subunit alpha [Tissierellaceae bacterium]QAT61725.1 oxaloacetate decarboxylase subunit alpha [Acidilutibacter cellobiosedens]SCL82544.1 Methylmalonyl-CoA carboxyltransferase 5S subunit [Sporanaerobacter sp. PP17-6a]